MSISTRIVARVLPTVTSAIVSLLPATAFSSDPTTRPAYYYEILLEATSRNPAECREAVAIRLEPVGVPAQRAGSLYQSQTYTDQPAIVGKPVEDGVGNWECWFTYRSRDLAPGTWRLVAEFEYGTQTCVRQVGPGEPNRVRIDEEDGCLEFSSHNH